MNVRFFSIAALLASTIVLMAFMIPQEKKKGGPWEIPQEYVSMENPYKDDASLEKYGKQAYMKHCRSCHGNTGEGDGPKARNLEYDPGNLSDAAWQDKVSDGELYYMSIIGRDEMPNYESKIADDEERWALINYLRSLKK
ncbi:MAG TPA: cytochrome c [Bacteroidales bacterium]|jgi:mono/diheme cytochrome c family protein|nr:cytochrome c [Bacteroidales bacterium]MDD4085614.1 cytochrome c [Bacteroidales bacterium]MDY0084322.1 cytochrome c [Bacteroidales bacterium]HPE43424.1 cytochrome c [Bacteroidales bacterium]